MWCRERNVWTTYNTPNTPPPPPPAAGLGEAVPVPQPQPFANALAVLLWPLNELQLQR